MLLISVQYQVVALEVQPRHQSNHHLEAGLVDRDLSCFGIVVVDHDCRKESWDWKEQGRKKKSFLC